MSQVDDPGKFSIVAVCRNHESVERAVRRLHEEGFEMCDLSIVGRDFQVSDHPAGFVTTGECAAIGSEIGAFVGGMFGLFIGMAFLVLPGLGPVIVAGPLVASLVGGIEGTAAGGAIGGLAGALVGWGIPSVHVAKYETYVKGGKFLVLARGGAKAIEHAKEVLRHENLENLEVYEASSNASGAAKA